MGRTAIYQHAVVQVGRRIELQAPPGMREGDEVDIVLLTNEQPVAAETRRPLLDILESLPSNIGSFKSAQEVDEYIRQERDSWAQ